MLFLNLPLKKLNHLEKKGIDVGEGKGDEVFLRQLLKSRNDPNLKTVAVPTSCWDFRNKETVSSRNKELWREARKTSVELERFTSGRVLSQLLKAREIHEYTLSRK